MGGAALTSLWLTLPCVVFLVTSAQPIEIKAESGKTACLPCSIASNIKVVEWSRPDLEPECVLLYQNEQFDADSQNPSFSNRVDLQDKQMKGGDVSLILKNVTIKDAGTYECRVLTSRRKRAVDPIRIIHLSVDPPGQTGGDTEDGGKEDGSVGLIVGLSVFAVLLVPAVIGVLMYRKYKQHKSQDSYQPPVEMHHV